MLSQGYNEKGFELTNNMFLIFLKTDDTLYK